MGGHDLHVRRDRDRSEGAVRRGQLSPAFGDRRDLLQFADAARDRDVGHDDVHGFGVEEGPEPLDEHGPFPAGEPPTCFPADLPVSIQVPFPHRLFQPVQVDAPQAVHDPAGFVQRETAVAVEEQIDIRPDGVPHGVHTLQSVVYEGIARAEAAVERRDLHRGMAVPDGARGLADEVLRRTVQRGPGDVGVHGDAVPAPSAEQGVDRDVKPLSEDVPQALLEGAQRMHGGPVFGTGLQSRGQPFDLPGILPHDLSLDLLQRGQDRTSRGRRVELAQPVHPFVGPDVHEYPVMPSVHVHRVEIDTRYAHGCSIAAFRGPMRLPRSDATIALRHDHRGLMRPAAI